MNSNDSSNNNNKNIYRSKYEAYTFLSDDFDDIRCDFEILTDYFASQISLLRASVKDDNLKDELLKVCEIVYHINPTLRTKKFSITDSEFLWLLEITKSLKADYSHRCKMFVVPQGSFTASLAHCLRAQSKMIVRMIYRYAHQGNDVSEKLLDTTNILSGYFFYLALKLNEIDSVDEIEYTSRNYKIKL